LSANKSKSGLIVAALVFLIIANLIIWGYIILHRLGGEGEVIQLWDSEELFLDPEGEFNSLLPGPSSDEPDGPEEFQLRTEELEEEQP